MGIRLKITGDGCPPTEMAVRIGPWWQAFVLSRFYGLDFFLLHFLDTSVSDHCSARANTGLAPA